MRRILAEGIGGILAPVAVPLRGSIGKKLGTLAGFPPASDGGLQE
jgi:hypothetical protein